MDIGVVRQAFGAFGGGLLVWMYFRFHHRYRTATEEKDYIFFKAPSWLITICGRPRSDDVLELMCTLGQIGGLFLSVIWLPMYWLGFSHSQRIIIWGPSIVGTFFVFIVVGPSVIALYWRVKRKSE